MKKLVFIEGADKVGKSTIVEDMRRMFEGCYNLEISTHPKQFKKEITTKENILPLTRVLYGVIEHLNSYVEFENSESELIIQDRSFLSTLVYGLALGVDGDTIDNLEEELLSNLGKLKIDIYLIILTRDKPIEKDVGDIYSSISWDKFNNSYKNIGKQDSYISNHHHGRFKRKMIMIENLDKFDTIQKIEEFVEL